jgi:DMSO/TMAO reductase YedYZ molybdopterin-dependent catalytic subunit
MNAQERRPSLLLGIVMGGITNLSVMALSYLGYRLADLPFVPFDLFEWLTRILPGALINPVLDTMVRIIDSLGVGQIASVAKTVEQLLGILMFLFLGLVVGFVEALIIRRSRWPGRLVGALVGLVVYAFVLAYELNLGLAIAGREVVSLLWLAVLVWGWGTLLGMILAPGQARQPAAEEEEPGLSRRAFLAWSTAGSIALALIAWGLGRLLGQQQVAGGQAVVSHGTGTPMPTGSASAAGPMPLPSSVVRTATAEAVERQAVPIAPGTRPNVTSNAMFYRVDINLTPPNLDGADWQLEATGLFDNPRSLSLADLKGYPPTTQAITLCCISNPIGGDLISTAYVTGVRLGVVLQDLGLQSSAQALSVHSADGFFETVAMEDMMDPRTLLVYSMNGEALPAAHGYPLRLYIPNRYGMKQPKWMTGMEAVANPDSGYWEERDWSDQAIPHVVSIIDAVATDAVQNGQVPVGGIAWAGARGIQKVEVQVDNGSWAEAALRTPPVGPLTWVQWRYDWPRASGRHTFRVRATDGNGTLQVENSSGAFPDGATGYDSMTVQV